MKSGLLIYNPKAGGRDRTDEIGRLVEWAAQEGFALRSAPTAGPRDATRLAREGLEDRPDVIVVAGGDGTIGEAAEAVAGSEIPLAIYPAGTTNVLGRQFGIRTPDLAREAILSSERRPLAVWPTTGRVSLIGVGVGFDARVMIRTIPLLKKWFGRTGIGYTATLEWLKYEFPPIEITGVDASGSPFKREATFAVSANVPRYGGDPILSPFVDPGSDLLDLVLFSGRTKGSLIRFYHLLSRGKAEHLSLDVVERLPVRQFTARSLAGYELDFQVDGDGAGLTPVTVGPSAGHVWLQVPSRKG
ncbi:MAG: NAD(+)/NADH kinase [Thermoanaerobaculia bacterium]|nr:NAD(+)/NADH kinase [Thermoanaerobaculia bacterium]